jgi:DNA-binding PadR family transcriptional regulator
MSSDRRAPLTTTSYAILGMLAIRPWTAYELAQQMSRSLDRVWPKARSHLFNEPKKLVALGLATGTEETVGRRPRTRYAITPAGRRALRAWLSRPGEPPVLEFEELLKLFFADQGSRADAAATVRRIAEWAREQTEIHAAVARSYLAGAGPFPERAPVLAITGRFVADFAEMVQRWAERAAATLEGWPDDPRQAEPDWAALEEVARRGAAGKAAASPRRRTARTP